ncbi:MAG: heavy metal-binding domain-containing protein, partial [Prosthecobacter sp.]|uniref:heavy metal-binding domain-containing protein n=1 Tax=Prosthecobacter sp. TaxID=1965333 RepID=UPI003BAF0979
MNDEHTHPAPAVKHDYCGGHDHHGGDVKPSPAAKYFCPMCSGVESDKPGDCPKCGMTLVPKSGTAATEEDDSELTDMTRRMWIGALLSLPVFLLAMAHLFPGAPHWIMGGVSR